MDSENKTEKRSRAVHRVLADSYMVYLFALIFGLFLSATWPLKIFTDGFLLNTSATVLLLSSLLILWAQKSSRKFNKENVTVESFKKGPYRFTRNPTNVGLFLSVISFGIIVNSIFVIFLTLGAFAISRLFFIKEEEKILERKYGRPYLEYKKLVGF